MLAAVAARLRRLFYIGGLFACCTAGLGWRMAGAQADPSCGSACSPKSSDRRPNYSSKALQALIDRAASDNQRVPSALLRYIADVETEIGIVADRGDATEGAVQLEQIASEVSWARDGHYVQRVRGYRAQSLGPNLSAMSYLKSAWTVPVLYGNRLQLFFGLDTVRRDSSEKARRKRLTAVHPFATDRDSVYRFAGGDTVATLALRDHVIHLVRVHVEPVTTPPGATLLFSGDIDVDAERHQIARMRGRFVLAGDHPSLLTRIARVGVNGVLFFELANAEIAGAYWLPQYQRLELEATTSLADARSIVRVVSRFRHYEINSPIAAGIEPATANQMDDTLAAYPHPLRFAPRDSVERYTGWLTPIGRETSETRAEDFDDVAPDAMKQAGPPRLSFGARRFSELLRYDRVEGLYTGVGLVAQLRDMAPGASIRAFGGWAWSEGTVRGGGEVRWERDKLTAAVRAERALPNTNDFLAEFDPGATISTLFGTDYYDYVDRRSVRVELRRARGTRSGAVVGVSAGWTRDASARRHLPRGLFANDSFPSNRIAAAGGYLQTTGQLEIGSLTSGEFLQSGAGVRLRYEGGDGEARWSDTAGLLHTAQGWRRFEARATTRFGWRAATLAVRGDAGVIGGSAPPQAIFEIGGEDGLPGYAYKQFAGDRAVLIRGRLIYGPPFLRTPWRVWRFILPGLHPSPSFGVHVGWTDVSPANIAAVHALGSVTTDGARATVDMGMRIFGGAATLGLARSMDHADRWRFIALLGTDL